MPIFLGIDGGGSQTACVVGDETSILGNGTSGPSNLVRVGEQRAREALHESMRAACAAAGIDAGEINHVCVGLAGAARPEISDTVRRIVTEIVPIPVQIVGDMVTAMQAAFADGPGVIIVAGTGSIAYGRNAAGETARVGGWGFQISDEGSGHWIGRRAITQVMRAQDEEEACASNLGAKILKAWKLGNFEELIPVANRTPSPDFAQLFVTVLCAADAGDPLARAVLTEAGTELARLGKLAINKIFSSSERVPVAMAGGVFRNSALVRQVFYNGLRSACLNANISSTIVEPVKGALELARKRADVA